MKLWFFIRSICLITPVRSKNSIPLDIIGREFPRSPGVRFFMQTGLDPFRFVIIAVAGWMNQHQQHSIDYLLEENRVLRELIGSRRIRFSDDQRCRLAAKAKKLGRKLLAEIAKIVTPDCTRISQSARPECPCSSSIATISPLIFSAATHDVVVGADV